MYAKTIRIFMWLLMYPLMAAYTEDKGVILFFGTLAGLFAFFITWTVQLAFVNKRIPVDRDKVGNLLKNYKDHKTNDIFLPLNDPSDPSDPSWDI
jgi:hypothetical protein